MSGWLNLNESLNSLKGQISNFANNVLTENEEDTDSTATNYEELKVLFAQREREIENLKKVNEELQRCLEIPGSQNGESNDNNWNWNTPDLMVKENPSKENISDLKQLIKELENEKEDLINQLEQLDNENQQNLAELVAKREHLQDENNDLKEKCTKLKQENKTIMSREAKLTKELQELKNKLQESRSALSSTEYSDDKYANLVKNNQELKVKLEETTKELSVLKSTHDTLEKTLKETKVNAEKEVAELAEKLKKSEMENKIIYSELQKSRDQATLAQQRIQEDAENSQKLAHILESYETQVSSLKKELDNIKNASNQDKDKDIEILEKSNKELQDELSKALEKLDNLASDNTKVQNEFDEKIASLTLQLEEKTSEAAALKQEKKGDNDVLQKDIEKLNNKIKEMSLEKENMHRIYVSIITDNVKRYIDSDLVSSIPYESTKDPLALEFSKQVEDIFKMLLDYKEKCEAFEKEVLAVSQEKTELLNEKNSEIEKLIQNSEVLSQDIINKAETIKELETEVTNLVTSNDVLMSELDSYKSSGLQTISESNEDNMVLLETDLDNANRKIRELEKIIENGGKSLPSNDSGSTPLEGKVGEKLEDYQELLNSFDNLKVDYDTLLNELSEKVDRLSLIETENEDLKSQLEKSKAEFENMDYQLSEANFSIDGFKEELESIRPKLEILLQENKELKMQNMSSIDMKSELNEIKEKWLTEENRRRELETEIKDLVEKQQSLKMAETSLRLHNDTLNKELAAAILEKNNLEQTLLSAKSSISEFENNYTELLQRYDGILLRCEELNTKLHEKDNELLKLQNDFKLAQEQKQELEEVLNKKTLELQRHLDQQKTVSEDVSNVAKLEAQCQEQKLEIVRLNSTLKELENQNQELERLTKEKVGKIEEVVRHEDATKETVSSLENQFRLTEKKVASLSSELIESQQQNKNLQDFLNKSTGDNAQQTQETEVKSKCVTVDESILTKNEEVLEEENGKLKEKINKLQGIVKQSEQTLAISQQQLQELTNSRNELINMVTIKHQESLNYHNEIQRLSQVLKSENEKYLQLQAQLLQASNANQEIAKKNEENDKLIDQNNFLKEKCDLLAKNLLEEQAKLQQALSEKSGPSEKELSLLKQLERLQSHLMEMEEHYTQELLQAEQKNAELQSKVTSLEQSEKNSSNMYTSVSIRANQQVETLQNQLQMMTTQRNELRKMMSDAEDASSKQAAALANLQFVLEQFQKDKEKDVIKETERIRRQINVEKQVQENLRKEIDTLKEQLEESRVGLQAASRLSDQLEIVKKQNAGLKEEVSQLQQKLTRSQETIHNLTSQTDGKIDKSLIKNLIVGLLSSGNTHNWNKDQTQIIKIIATVLDFNQQDHDKVKLNQPQQGSWLGSILAPQPSTQNMSQESLSQAFVKFLENESKPRVVPSLLGSETSSRPSTSSNSSKRTTPRASPIVLNEIVLPTFADFGQSRNSSSILKDVLKDNNNS